MTTPRDAAIELASDPGSPRLTKGQAIKIHRRHNDGIAWEDIAAEIGTSRKNVQRIVQGRRHRSVHPAVAPELYTDARPTMTIHLDSLAGQVAKRVYDMLMDPQAQAELARQAPDTPQD